MKKMKQKSAKIIIALIAIILIAGTIMICTKGLVFGLNYEESKKVEINLGKQFEEKDIKEYIYRPTAQAYIDTRAQGVCVYVIISQKVRAVRAVRAVA